MTEPEIIVRIGRRPALKRDGSSAKAIADYERKLAALDPPNKQIPSIRKISR